MKKQINFKKIFYLICLNGIASFSTSAMASAFQLWEQDAASVANYHAGRAALATDASIAFYNPAGMTRIKNQQLVIGDVGILTDIKFRGTVATNTFAGGVPQSVTAQGGTFSQVPNLHYVAPISNAVSFGLSLAAPFGLKTVYGRTTPLQYAATTTQLKVVDLSPALGVNLTEKFSLGVGLDAQRMSAELGQTGVLTSPATATTLTDKGVNTAYGFHLGALYQFHPTTRLGLAYNSQVVHHLSGTSKAVGPLATLFNSQPIVSEHARANITLPPFTTLSLYHQLNSRWALMGTAVYTKWNVVENLVLQNVAGISAASLPSNTLTVIIPQHYRNSWNVSLGADFSVTDALILRGGVGYDETPTVNSYRIIQIPDNDRYAVALGGHYQASKTLGVDLGWTHLFVANGHIASPPQVTGAQVTRVRGSTQSNADIVGAQLTWDIV